ncbi:MAG: TIGR00730 family Rossman fold protein [Oscillospiraceae bacterium]|nr:TIGR00730 family Rossman fold protein [Oscillospiraceae bacterium]
MNICVFGASADKLDPAYFAAAEELGALLHALGHRLIYGGGKDGLMGACARGVIRAGGRPLGIAPRFFDEPGILDHEGAELLFTETMAERKSLMLESAEAFIALPGGIGTLDEFFEALTLRQLGQHGKPIVLLNTLGFYDALDAVLRSLALDGFMSAQVLEAYALCASPAEALRRACAPAADRLPRTLSDYNA